MIRFNPSLKLVLHDQFLEYYKGNKIYPISIEISLTGDCNANCEWCFYKSHQIKTEIDYDILLESIRKLKHKGLKSISWTGGGEPTLYSKFSKIVNAVNLLDIEQGLFTNAIGSINYDPSIFKWIRVSKTNMDLNIDNIKKLRKCKSLGVCINYSEDMDLTYLKGVYDILDYVQVRPILLGKGKTYKIKTPILNNPKIEITNYKFDNCSIKHKYDYCEGHNFVPFLWQDGLLTPCAYMRDTYKIGNINNTDIIELINKMPTKFKVLPICQVCCKNDEINKLIHDAQNIKDVNFP